MHSLPSPVERRGQKSYKPEFFDVLKKEREADEAARETVEWVRQVRFTSLWALWWEQLMLSTACRETVWAPGGRNEMSCSNLVGC